MALLAALVTGVVAYRGAEQELRRAADDKLVSLREARVASLDSLRQDLRFMASIGGPLVDDLTALSLWRNV